MEYFDAHTHVQFVAYDGDREEVIARVKEAKVGMNVVGTQLDTSVAAVELARKHDSVWASIGLHPVHTSKSYHDTQELGPSFAKASKGKEGGFVSRGEIFDFAAYEALGKDPKVVAIGECGLDYYRVDESTKDVQIDAFVQQIELANSLNKPLMLHIRNGAGSQTSQGSLTSGAYQDALEIIKTHAKVRGDVHFFAGDWGVAKKFLDLGFTLSFTGVVTFTHDYDEVVKNAPLDMILSETDAPYITPVPFRGTRNESTYIPKIVETIARIRDEDPERVRLHLLENAQKVFSLS